MSHARRYPKRIKSDGTTSFDLGEARHDPRQLVLEQRSRRAKFQMLFTSKQASRMHLTAFAKTTSCSSLFILCTGKDGRIKFVVDLKQMVSCNDGSINHLATMGKSTYRQRILSGSFQILTARLG